MPKLRSVLALALTAAALQGCGKDSTTGPSVTFPTLPAQMLAAFCVQGERQPAQAISGTIATSDCVVAVDGSYYEVWRIRVPSTGAYQFAASSTFDNYLIVYHLDSYTDNSATLTSVAADDDSGPGTNALIASASLTAGQDYFLVVNGYSPTDVGPYTATFTKP